MTTVIIGGTSGIGLEVVKRRAARGEDVVLTGRDTTRAQQVASSLEGSVRGLGVDLSDPHGIAGALAGIDVVDHLVIAAVERDNNVVRDYDIDRAARLVTLKLVGYTEVVHTLLPRMHDESSIVLFGGLAKDHPYPGSVTVASVNGGVVGMVHALALELAPIRINAIHPGIIGDSPFWSDKPDGILEGYRSRTATGRLPSMEDITGAVDFLLANRGATGIQLGIDNGWLLT